MKRLILVVVVLAGLGVIPRPSLAAKAYVSDSFKITLRTGPTLENKVIAMLSSGDPVEVLESEGDWSRVRTSASGDSQQEGWVMSRYLMDRPPWEARARVLAEENTALGAKLTQLEGQWKEASQQAEGFSEQLQANTKALEKAQADYESLKREASEYLKLKEAHSRLQANLDDAQAAVQRLTRENEGLKFSAKMKWFALGALVVLIGWIIGLSMGRMQRRRRSPYY